MLDSVSRGNVSKNIFGLEITVGKEMKYISIKKIFLRGMHFDKNINSIVTRPIQGDGNLQIISHSRDKVHLALD